MAEREFTALEKLLIDWGWVDLPRTLTVDEEGQARTHGASGGISNSTGLHRQEATPRDLNNQSRLAPTPPPPSAYTVEPKDR